MRVVGDGTQDNKADPGPRLATVATRVPRGVPPIPVGIATRLSLLTALAVTLAEIDHVLSQVVRAGKSWSPSQLSSPSTVFELFDFATTKQGWRFFHTEARLIDADALTWLRVFGVVDLLLVACYVSLVWSAACGGSTAVRRRGAQIVILGGCADAIENFFIIIGKGSALIPWCTTLKWLALLCGAALLMLSVRTSVRPTTVHVLWALYTHRYTVAVVLPLAVLGLASGTDILEQVPDIQRAWFDTRPWDALSAGLILGLVGITMLYVGRQRTDHVWLRTCDEWTSTDHPNHDVDCPARVRQQGATTPLLHIWFVGPVVLGILALVAASTGGTVAPGPLAAFCAVPIAIAGLSLYLRRRHDGPPARPVRRPVSLRRYDVTALVGDLLVGLLTVVAGLGSIRAFTGLVLLDPQFGNFFMVGVGFAGVLLAWPLHDRVLRWLAGRSQQLVVEAASTEVLEAMKDEVKEAAATRGEEVETDKPAKVTPGERSMSALTPGVDVVRLDAEDQPVVRTGVWDTFVDQRWNWIVLSVSLVLLLVTAIAPFPVATALGVIGTFELALGCLSVVVASTVILLQKGGAPEAFWIVGIPYAPVTALLLISAVVAGTRSNSVHDIRAYEHAPDHETVTAADRPTIEELFQTWLEDDEDCAKEATGNDGSDSPLEVRPMLLYAAEGGGVRAAYWTAKVVDRIGAPRSTEGDVPVAGICRSAFLSSGASGGSVGLTIASVSPLGMATDAVKKIAGPQSLAAASDGLVLRDTLFAATGVPLPSVGGPDEPDWADRATLIEQSWERSTNLEQPFLRSHSDWTWSAPGALVVNSTSTTTSCRTLISQIQVVSTPGVCTSGAEQPEEGAVSAANSTDLAACTGQLRSTTAALLTARFPYVTPSGVVDCKDERLQVVDGGYAENFGVGTVVDLAPQLMELVRAHNTCALAASIDDHPGCPQTTASMPLVAPMLVYFDNGTGSDLAVQPASLNLEVLVPPVTILTAKRELYAARSQLARASNLLATDQLWDQTAARSDEASQVVDEIRKNPVVIVFQATKPQVAGPLGWVLSEASMRSMDSALSDLEDEGGVGLTESTTSDPLYDHTLSDVLNMLPGNEVLE